MAFKWNRSDILMFVLGVGSSNMKINVFGFAEKIVQGVASHVFGQARSDGTPANGHDQTWPRV
jgi:hypothetical protein